MLNLLLMSFRPPTLVVCVAGTRHHFNACLCAWRQIAKLIWWMQAPYLSLTFSRPYVLAVPEVLWTLEQIGGYFIGKTVRQLGAHHKAKQMFRWLVAEVNSNFVGSDNELKRDADAEDVRREETDANTPAKSYKDGWSKIFIFKQLFVYNGRQIVFSSLKPKVSNTHIFFYCLLVVPSDEQTNLTDFSGPGLSLI